MGDASSKPAQLLEKSGWPVPEGFGWYRSGLDSYLANTALEVTLPMHAPQNDPSESDFKLRTHPRPTHLHEGYKMHCVFMGPSGSGKSELLNALKTMVNVMKGPAHRLGPGREAVLSFTQ